MSELELSLGIDSWSVGKGRHKGGTSHQKENGGSTVELAKMCMSPAW